MTVIGNTSTETNEATLDPDTERASRLFLERLEGRYVVVGAFVYGSRARRTHRPDSDADLAIVLGDDATDRDAAARSMSGIAFDVMMETGILIQALVLRAADLEQPNSFGNPALIRDIRRDGVRL